MDIETTLQEGTEEMNEMDEILRTNIRLARINANLNQKDVSKLINAKQNYICRVETGQRKLLASFLYELCKLYNVDIKDMFDKNYPSKIPPVTKKRLVRSKKEPLRFEKKPKEPLNFEKKPKEPFIM